MVQSTAAFYALFFSYLPFYISIEAGPAVGIEAWTPLAMWTLILDGTRSGKSRLTRRLAMRAARVTYVAIAEGGQDLEMAPRLQHYNSKQPCSRRRIETPQAVVNAAEPATLDVDAAGLPFGLKRIPRTLVGK